MKKKLDDTYNPDGATRKSKVLIGLSGSIDSLVTAYLLKIQKYELVAVTVINSWESLQPDQSKIMSCHITPAKLDEIKEFCHKLGIPLHVLRPTAEFNETVASEWIADKVLGRFPKPCWLCHENRMFQLHQMMLEVGAKQIATGHYAKVFYQSANDSVFVHTSNDEQNDQSSSLSRLPREILKSLLLPLSELTKKEVIKLAENFGLKEESGFIKTHECFPWNEELSKVIEKQVPKKIIKPGDIIRGSVENKIGDHPGVQHHKLGDFIEYRELGKPVKGLFVSFSYADKKIALDSEEVLMKEKFMLIKCHFSEDVSLVEPIRCVLHFLNGEYAEGWIHLKTLSSVYIEVSPAKKVLPGEIVTVLKKKGKNAKIYLTGEVQLLSEEPLPVEGDGPVEKYNYDTDF